jgi:hypothetical protein
VKECLFDRLYKEYEEFKSSILKLSKSDIFNKCYEIDVMTNIYDILMDRADLSDEETVALLGRKHILYELYGLHLKRDDYNYPELENLVNEEIRIL